MEDIYYLGTKLQEIKGNAVINILRKVPIIQKDLEKFQDPDYNKGYNLIILENKESLYDKEGRNITSLTRGFTASNFTNYDAKTRDEWYKKDCIVEPPFTSVGLLESEAFRNTIDENRGFVAIYLPKGGP